MKNLPFKILFVLIIPVLISGCVVITDSEQEEIYKILQEQVEDAKANIENIQNLELDQSESDKLIKSEEGDIYYVTSNDVRYIFPTVDIFTSWFPEVNQDDIPVKTIEELYDTRLGGNVYIKPSTLIQTETDPKVYFVGFKGGIHEVSDLSVLDRVYWQDWKPLVLDVENKYFTNYKYTTIIDSVSDIPFITPALTIDLNQ